MATAAKKAAMAKASAAAKRKQPEPKKLESITINLVLTPEMVSHFLSEDEGGNVADVPQRDPGRCEQQATSGRNAVAPAQRNTTVNRIVEVGGLATSLFANIKQIQARYTNSLIPEELEKLEASFNEAIGGGSIDEKLDAITTCLARVRGIIQDLNQEMFG